MKHTILITGSTDGIGYETAKLLVGQGHHVLLHGRSQEKLDRVSAELTALAKDASAQVESYRADLSSFDDVKQLASEILHKHDALDVLINNAGILKTPNPITPQGLDVRFVVNTLSPYLLTRLLLPIMNNNSRVVNLSSAAQAPIHLDALSGKVQLHDHMAAYAQSKLAITIWTQELANELSQTGPAVIAVNPGSLLASKIVKEGFGMPGNDIAIGANILIEAALSEKFSKASGKYFDNDIGQFSLAHPDSQDAKKCDALMLNIHALLESDLKTA